MYTTFKKLFNSLFPDFIHKNEFALRKLLAILYVGNKYCCNICGIRLRKFIVLENADLSCPRCGSLGRHRRLWRVINEGQIIQQTDFVLQFSPSKILQRKFKATYPNYISSDYNGNLRTDESYNILNIESANESFSIIICYHVLEHIIDDLKALSELFRILKPGGKMLIQTPFKEGDIYEDFTITSEADRLKHFGQEDHVRIYSVKGLKTRIEKASFEVEVLSFNETANNTFGFKEEEKILLCTKPA